MNSKRLLLLAVVLTLVLCGSVMAQVYQYSDGIDHAQVLWRQTARYADSGGDFQQMIDVYVGRFKKFVDVQLRGWDLEFASDDHHIDMVKVFISNVSYNPDTGRVTFTVQGTYKDKNGDDDFYWQVWYTVLTLF